MAIEPSSKAVEGGEGMGKMSRVVRAVGILMVFISALAVSSRAGEPRGGSSVEALSAVESAFADSMAKRDLEAFVAFLDDEVVFFNGDRELRGKSAVAEAWAPFFEGDLAPFSWRPEVVSVLESGRLGLTSGPVLDPDGHRIGTFNSIWRRLDDGSWRIVFDRGCQ